MTRLILAALLLSAACFTSALQAQLKASVKPKAKIAAPNGPVTQAEAYAMFQKVEKVFREVNGITATSPKTKLHQSNAPVTRDQTIVEMARLFDIVEPRFTLKTNRQAFDPSLFTIQEKAAKSAASKLVAWGCIGRFAPLVTSRQRTMEPTPYGDAVGLFIARIAELTHVPSSRFSPYLKTIPGQG